ncbi:hypothetical protein GCM10018781_80850 [Kitasatospora indigofera]|uniref:Uncharacterized protein n=1 Tax=Kitasatospora indigofera TaxID=67307 RepID=A0A918YYT9_9ACTN|nr:Imm21 family immunity protein [Kitasatospora indigofera]GHE28605.1 hypothetical protein GCM10018781_80850 [Kitasatospora indigofera]
MVKWIDVSDFGYYALRPESHVAACDGAEFMDALEDCVARVLKPGLGEVLILGGEALPVTYLDRRMTFVRQYAAEDDSALEQAVDRAMGSDDWTDAFEIWLGGSYRLMDCLISGADAARTAETDTIRVHVPEGRDLVQSLFIEAFQGDQFMLERLVRI